MGNQSFFNAFLFFVLGRGDELPPALLDYCSRLDVILAIDLIFAHENIRSLVASLSDLTRCQQVNRVGTFLFLFYSFYFIFYFLFIYLFIHLFIDLFIYFFILYIRLTWYTLTTFFSNCSPFSRHPYGFFFVCLLLCLFICLFVFFFNPILYSLT